MAPNHRKVSTPHATVGFAFAITFAVVTMWLAGLVVEVHSYTGAQPAQVANPEVTPTPTSCPFGADDPAQCGKIEP